MAAEAPLLLLLLLLLLLYPSDILNFLSFFRFSIFLIVSFFLFFHVSIFIIFPTTHLFVGLLFCIPVNAHMLRVGSCILQGPSGGGGTIVIIVIIIVVVPLGHSQFSKLFQVFKIC